MKINAPALLYRGESYSKIRKSPPMSFPAPSEGPDKITEIPCLLWNDEGEMLDILSDPITADNTDYTADMTRDQVGIIKNHQSTEILDYEEFTLSFTSDLNVAKWFATNEGKEPGVVYVINSQLVLIHSDSFKFFSLTNPRYPQEKEWTLLRHNTKVEFAWSSLKEVITVDPSNETITPLE